LYFGGFGLGVFGIEGALAWLWRKIVAEGIVKELPEQAERLIRRTRAVNGLI
jgi:hypothetical protein